jgi:glycosyltransferase involved in cell wall biosynthesis
MLLEHARAGVRVIVPDIGREASRVVRLVESCRLGETLRAVGRRFTLPQLLAAADLAVYLPTGGAPLTGVIQAMAAGRPIVASDVPVIRELLAHGRTAWLCRPGDPKDACRRMLQALENHGQSSRQAKAARAHANAAFGRRRMIAQYRRVYENLLADRPLAEGLAELGLVD